MTKNRSEEEERKMHHRRAVEAFRSSETSRWVACLHSYAVVSSAQPMATAALASDMSISTSYVRRMSQAYYTYSALRSMIGPLPKGSVSVSGLRKKLTVGHFAVLGEKWRAYEFSPQEAYEYLLDCYNNNTSVESLRDLLDAIESGSPGAGEWVGQLRSVMGMAAKLATSYGIPDKLREITRTYLEQAAEYIGSGA